MTAQQVVHDTFVVETAIESAPAEVFAAFADVRVREEWAAPGGDTIVYEKADFRIGGVDVFRCGPKNDQRFHGTVWYHEIVPDHRIVYVEAVRVGDEPLSLALVTLELVPEREGTRLRSTNQLVSFTGAQMLADSRSGTRAALHNLAAWCARAASW
jgi:uncharacterized protein YndB with AHSA1/START domain